MAVEISYADFTIIALLVLFGFDGYRAGFFNSFLTLGGFYIALIFALLLLTPTAKFFNFVLELPTNISILIGFSSLFVIMMLLYTLFLQWLHSLIKMEVVDWFNRLSGTFIGLFKGLLTASLLAIGFSLLPLPDLIHPAEQRSLFFRPVKCITPGNYDYFRKLIPANLPSLEESLKAAFVALGEAEDKAKEVLKPCYGETLGAQAASQ